MSFLAALGGELLGSFLGKSMSSAIDLKTNEKLMEKQFDLQKQLFEYENSNKHQFEVSDLRAAGLNPILSATGGSAVGGGSISAPTLSSDDDAYNSARQRMMQQQAIDAQSKEADANMITSLANDRNANTNTIVGNSNVLKNTADARVMNANASTAEQLLPLQVEAKKQEMENNRLVAQAQAGYFHTSGQAQMMASSAKARESDAVIGDLLKKQERYGFEKNKAFWDSEQSRVTFNKMQHKYNVRAGLEPASSAYDLYDTFMRP